MNSVIFDIETDNFYQDVTKLHCIALKRLDIDNEVQLYDVLHNNLDEALDILEQADRLIGHNIISFDIPVLEKLYPNRHFTRNVLDTLNLSYITNQLDVIPSLENWGKELGFEKYNPVTGQEYTPEEWKERKKNKAETFINYTPEMGEYCKQDVRVTELVLWRIQQYEIPEYVIELSNNFAWIISEQVRTGCLIDKSGLEKLNETILADEEKAKTELLKILPDFIDYKQQVYKRANKNKSIKAGDIEVTEVITPFNLNSTPHWIRYLREKYGYEPPTVRRKGKDIETVCLDDEVLATIEDDYPEIKDLLNYKKATKIRKMIYSGGTSVYNKLDKNSVIHGEVVTEGTNSGRCAHNKPNLSTMPGVKKDQDDKPILGIKASYAYEVRSLFIARPGYKFVGFDAKGLEYMCLAHYVNNEHFSRDVIENGDIHTWTQHTLGFERRKEAKTFEYAYLYGAGKRKLAQGLSKGTGKVYTLKDVDKAIAKFNSALPGLQELQDDLRWQYRTTGGIKGLDGRHLNARSEHSLLNLLLQSSGAVLMKQTLVFLKDELDKVDMKLGQDYNFLLNVHDEVQAEVLENKVETYKRCVQKAVDRTNKFFKTNCKLQIDLKVGNNWAECH